MKIHTDMLQEGIIKLKSQLEVKQKQIESSEDVKAFTSLQEECSRLKLRLQHQMEYATMPKEENSKLTIQSSRRQNILKGIDETKVRIGILEDEKSELESQLKVKIDELKISEVEKKQYIDKYSVLINKQRCDIAIQTNEVSVSSLLYHIIHVLMIV